jgi:hypothetical protein
MKDTRLVEIIRTFNEEEIKLFRKFLDSPFNKSGRNTGTLLNYLIQFRPEYDSPRLEYESIYKKIFPGEKYDEKKLTNHITDLTRSAKDFLIHKRLDEDEIDALIFLCSEYHERKLLKNNFNLLKTIENKLVSEFSSTNNYFSKFRQLNFMKSAVYTENNEFEKSIGSEIEYFSASATQFIIDYTKFLSSKNPAMNTHGLKMETNFTESIIKCFDIDKLISLNEKEEFLNTSLISLHYYRLKTIEEPDKLNHYELLKEYFYKNIERINREEKYFLFAHLQNYCVLKVHEGQEAFKKEGFEIYKSMLENNAYSNSESEYMEVMIYRNIVYYATMFFEMEWLKKFIEKYTDSLHPEYREDLRNFSYANFYFYKKDFEKALGYISKRFNHEIFLFKTDVKNLMAKIYFELNHTEQAFSLVDSYKHFLSLNKELPESFKIIYNKFLKYYFELLKIKSGQSKETPSFIKSKIEKENKLVFKKWLLEKSQELSKKIKT